MTRRSIAGGVVLMAMVLWPMVAEGGMGREALAGLDAVNVQAAVCPPIEERLGQGALRNVISEQLILYGVQVKDDPSQPRLVAFIDCSNTEIVPGKTFWRLEMALLEEVSLVRDPKIQVPMARVWSTPGINGLSEPERIPDDIARGVEQVLGDFLADHQAVNPRPAETP